MKITHILALCLLSASTALGQIGGPGGGGGGTNGGTSLWIDGVTNSHSIEYEGVLDEVYSKASITVSVPALSPFTYDVTASITLLSPSGVAVNGVFSTATATLGPGDQLIAGGLKTARSPCEDGNWKSTATATYFNTLFAQFQDVPGLPDKINRDIECGT